MENVTCKICGEKFDRETQDFYPFIEIKKEKRKSFYLCADCITKMANQIESFTNYMEDADDVFKEDESFHKLLKNKHSKIDYSKTSPLKIKKYLDEYIVGQEEAKKIISVAYYNHLKRISLSGNNKNEIKKSNIIMAGPTGSGKTLICRKLADMSNVPFAVADATNFTKKGYVGDDVENVLRKLYLNANKDISLAEKGIVYIDECDKLSTKTTGGATAENTVGGQSVQQALLKMIEGAEVDIGLLDGRRITLDTSNILFICGGAFVGMEENSKKNRTKSIGFGSQQTTAKEKFQPETKDFVSYGMIPELVGRLPVIITLNQLTEDDLVKVMKEPKDCILKEYQKLFSMDNMELEISNEAIKYIAHQAIEKKVGARGLRGILEKAMNEIIFQVTGNQNIKKIILTKKFIQTANLSDLKITKDESLSSR